MSVDKRQFWWLAVEISLSCPVDTVGKCYWGKPDE